MFRGISLFRTAAQWWRRRPVTETQNMTFVARFPADARRRSRPDPPATIRTATIRTATGPKRPTPVHRQRILAMQIAHSRICTSKRAARLAELGILTCHDLTRADLRTIASHFASSKKALTTLKRYRSAIRMASSLPGLMPIDALILIGVHRRSVTSLAMQNAAHLRLDLTRFASSSSGRATLRGRQIPSLRRIKRWIAEAEKAQVPVAY